MLKHTHTHTETHRHILKERELGRDTVNRSLFQGRGMSGAAGLDMSKPLPDFGEPLGSFHMQ